MNVLNAATQHQYCILVVGSETITKFMFVRLVKQYRVLWLQQRIVCLSLMKKVNLIMLT